MRECRRSWTWRGLSRATLCPQAKSALGTIEQQPNPIWSGQLDLREDDYGAEAPAGSVHKAPRGCCERPFAGVRVGECTAPNRRFSVFGALSATADIAR